MPSLTESSGTKSSFPKTDNDTLVKSVLQKGDKRACLPFNIIR